MKTVCRMRDVYRALAQFEAAFAQEYQLSLKEAMVLCALQEAGCAITSTTIAERTETGRSHTSKLLRTIENKGLIERSLGERDKREMYFSLTAAGEKRLQELSLEKIEMPDFIRIESVT